MLRTLLILPLWCVLTWAQSDVLIHINAAETLGPAKPVWAYFGYDEPNYTYANNGQKLIRELVDLSQQPVHIRTHFLLATGDGTPGLKWGSTNAYTETASGKSVYDWSIVDRILDTYVKAGAVPFVEVGFMPQALSTRPQPYSVPWIPGSKNANYFSGWTYPPSDYEKWSELVFRWVTHSVERYGQAAVQRWDWEVWNEPDIPYWHGTADEYDKLYDYTVRAIKRALPSARVGGPASTGPDSPKAAAFLRQFLQHCASGRNYATGESGAPLDFITFHVKGRPSLTADHLEMGLSQEMKDAASGFGTVASFAQFRSLPIVLSEADPEGCAACSARFYPQNAYRNGPLYASYEAAAFKTLLTLAERAHVVLSGILTWAFEFEDQPYFAGFRTLATNGIDKPVLNFFRMAGLLHGDMVRVDSNRAVSPEAILKDGVKEHPDVDAIASRSARELSIMVWNYQDKNVAGSSTDVDLQIDGLPQREGRLLMQHFRIDESHSNAYSLWEKLGSPQTLTADQNSQLKAAGQLQLFESPRWIDGRSSPQAIHLSLPPQSISLVELSW